MSARYDASLPLYFQHVPKAAGTSVAALLASVYRKDEICPVAHWDTIARLDDKQLDSFSLFIGHYSSYLPRYLGRPVNTFAFIRDPVERTISHYEFIRRDTTHPFHSQTVRLSLREFVLAPETRPNVENYQAREVADLGIDPRSLAAYFAREAPTNYPFQKFVDEQSLKLSRTNLHELALAGIERYFAIAPIEDIDACLADVGRTIGKPLDNVPRENVAPTRPDRVDLDSMTLEAIHDATAVDQALYHEVKRLSPWACSGK